MKYKMKNTGKKRKNGFPSLWEKCRKPFFLLLTLIVIFSVLALWYRFESPKKNESLLEIHFPDVGQGGCAFLLLPDGSNILIDTGPKEASDKLIRYLRTLSVEKIDLLILTHEHSDHIGGVRALLDAFPVSDLILSRVPTSDTARSDLLSEFEKQKNCRISLALAGDEYVFGEMSFRVLSPNSPSYLSANNASLSLRMQYHENAFLFTSDIENESICEILDRYGKEDLSVDLMQIPHHGSSSSASSEFFSLFSPKYAVIQCALLNDYGHPHGEILSLLNSFSIPVFRTDFDGDLVFTCDGKRVFPPVKEQDHLAA